MNKYTKPFSLWTRSIALLCALSVAPGNIYLMAEDASAAPAASAMTPQQIDSLVAPIALYPDELLSQILVASTYPLEIVQAYQWMQKHPELKGKDLTTAAQQQSWDPSVQALVAFPDLVKRMNQDVTWTTNLGNAFLANQSGVMDEIQKMRSSAEDAGKLKSTEQQKVVNTTDSGKPVVEIEPASPDVIYVPEYDPVWIWGPAPVYYPYAYWDYPPEPPVGLWCWWGPEIFMGALFIGWGGWGGWGWHPGWYGHSIVMNHRFFVGNHFRESHFVNVHGRAVWAHDPGHRVGVAYPNRALASHYNQPARIGAAHITVGQTREQLTRSSARVHMDRIGSRQISSGGNSRNRTAFGGIEAGSAARTYSARGNTSISHMQTGGGVSHGGGIGSHGGGGMSRGGGGGGHGGGGGRR